ncbi:MAG TPA: hypothetical protein VMM76_06475 [Pirellulaceae bacterium]|nr:hypothetical protein [Pirellulaceae bacterium]
MKIYVYCLVAALLGTATTWGQDRDRRLDRSAVEDGVEVLTRGPVHEAFAGTITFDPEPGVVVRKPAPEPIEELPPEQKPTGDNVAWIPGYWGWDDERDDYLWVSGIWRSLPPGRQWISGYWATSAQDSQWTSGYWADAQATEVAYLPEPPRTVEAGPNIEAPSVNHTWLPGVWTWQQNRYAWRPGYWATAQQNWVWNPPHYVWAPRGYVFVDGYYDYPVARRGVLFAPVYFNSSVYAQRGYSFSPRTVINPAVFAAHLFLRPSYGHYYFGDYYGNNYATSGFSPWFSFASNRMGYDPFYAHQNWNHRNDLQWNQRVETQFAYLSDHDEARPARTWSDQLESRNLDGANDDKTFVVAASIEELVKSEDTTLRFQPLAQQEREEFGQRGQQVREAREQRRTLEAEVVSPSAEAPVRNVESPIRAQLPKSSVASQPSDRLDVDNVPPKALDAPQPDTNIQPQPRRPRGNVDPTKGNPNVPQTGPRPNVSPANPSPPQAGPKPTLPKGDLNATPSDPQPKPPRGTPKGDLKPVPRVAPGAAPQGDPRPLTPSEVPQPAPKVTPRPDPPGIAPMPEPKITPRAESPRNTPKAAPTVTPRPERPKNLPKAASPVAPKATPQVNPRPEPPRNAPQPTPKVTPRPEPPRDATPKAPKAKPKPESPKAKP